MKMKVGQWNVYRHILQDGQQSSNVDFNELRYTDYQIKRSHLVDIGIDCIKSFPLDYMHLECLCVMKRILMLLKSGPRECKLPHQQIEELSGKLVALNGKMPREFARQPRSLEVLDRWKATKYRVYSIQWSTYFSPYYVRRNASSFPFFVSCHVNIAQLRR